MSNIPKPSHIPFLINTAIFLLIVYLLLNQSLASNDEKLTYSLDDAYIHLAIAKNAVEHSVWGVTSEGFTSSSSSLLWSSLLIVLYKVTGELESLPFILNVLVSLLLLYVVYKELLKHFNNVFLLTILPSAILTAVILPFHVFSGMEHILHMLLTLLFIRLLLNYISNKSAKPELAYLLVITFLLTSVRFESFFLIFVTIILLAGGKRYLALLSVISAALLPVIIYGYYSVSHGWYFLPNSVLLKGNQPEASFLSLIVFVLKPIGGLFKYSIHLLAIIAVLLLVYRMQKLSKEQKYFLFLFGGTFFLHLLFAKVPGAFKMEGAIRYDSYLILSGVLLAVILTSEKINQIFTLNNFRSSPVSRNILNIALIFIFAFPLLYRGVVITIKTPVATTNIYQQQIQMGRFFSKYYNEQNVGVNDIGAVSLIKRSDVVDLWGLSDPDAAAARIEKRYTSEFLADLIHKKDVKALAIYDLWFDKYPLLKSSMVKAGEWEIKNNVICGDSVVSFYAPDSISASDLSEKLTQYSGKLPESVIYRNFLKNKKAVTKLK